MHLRLITGSAAALLLLSGTIAMAGGTPGLGYQPEQSMRHDGRAPAVHRVGLFDIFGSEEGESREPSVNMAQAADPRVTRLEEEIRRLSGTVEELNFQVLQMQEQLRKMQEDNEFRFQELEKGGSGGAAGAAANKKSETSPAKGSGGVDGSLPAPGDTTATVPPKSERTAKGSAQDSTTGMPVGDLGTITVDENGNVKTTSMGRPSDPLSGGVAAPSDNTTVAALPSTDDPDELYRNAYEFILSGDYPTAEAGFRDHINRFPADPRAADAHYWLGEAMLGQRKYRDAAEIFLAASKDYSNAAKAPDMLLKLGVSLKELNQREVACATFREVSKRYPKSSDALKQRVKQEQALAGC